MANAKLGSCTEYRSRDTLLIDNNTAVAYHFRSLLVNEFAEKDPLLILDVGVGSGLDLSIFESLKIFRTYGIDLSPKMVEVAAEKAPHSTFFVGDFRSFDFGELRFHGVFAQAFIHLFPKKEVPDIFRKMFHLLVPRGMIHFSTTMHQTPSENLEEVVWSSVDTL